MRGSLDDHPLTITMSRAKVAWLLLGCVAFSAVGFWIWSDPQNDIPWLAKAGFVMFAVACPVLGWELIRPQRLILSPVGLQWFGPWKMRLYRWDQLSEFSVGSVRGSKLIRFSRVGDAAPRSRQAKLISRLTGATDTFPGLWEIAPDQLADLLNEARARWGGPSSA